MTLKLADKWMWDFWLAQDGVDYHVFYLQAPRTLAHSDLRHTNATVGHAVSQDLIHWEILPDALHAGAAGAWDDCATWTGSVIQHDGLWYMIYTGISHAENGLVQRIGVATSHDLITWEKHPNNPVMQADAQWYELLGQSEWRDQAWRDPWVFQHNGAFYALITARVNYGAVDGRGVVALATSQDLLTWEVLPPLTYPGEFGHLEVPQLTTINGQAYLLFCTGADSHAAARLSRIPQSVMGTHYLMADSIFGDYRYTSDDFLVGDVRGTLYAGKLLHDPQGNLVFMAWQQWDSFGEFAGELSNPYPVTVDPATGHLSVEWRNRQPLNALPFYPS